MKPARFAFAAPRSREQVLALMAEHGEEARILAGGQSLVPLMNLRLVQPAMLVSINHCDEFDRIEASGDGILIGARTRQIDAEESALVRQRCPLLAQILPWVGARANRNRGTVCGSIAHADPLAELPAAALALDAEIHLASRGGRRRVAAADFFLGQLTTAIRPGEIVEAVSFAGARAGERCAFVEVGVRQHGFAVAGVALRLLPDAAGNPGDIRLAAIGGGAMAMRLRQAEAALRNRPLDQAAIAAAIEAARQEVDPPQDIHADAAYRRDVIGTLVGRALAMAA